MSNLFLHLPTRTWKSLSSMTAQKMTHKHAIDGLVDGVKVRYIRQAIQEKRLP